MRLELDEVRRLTGINLLSDRPGALVDILLDEGDTDTAVRLVDAWHQQAASILAGFGWGEEIAVARTHELGVNLAISAPMDALYTACDLAELIWECCAAQLRSETPPDLAARLAQLGEDLAAEVNPKLLALLQTAADQRVSCLVDDDELSLGMGATARVWPVDALPDSENVEWQNYRDIPAAYITGTNGKSTCVRLAAEIARAAGINAGVTSTDFIRVGDDIIDRGDYSGPGGARMLLRDPRTEMAFLEVARGGLLRRGLPVPSVNAALVTNVASDHLGQYGINTVDELAETKFMIARALNDDQVLVSNADNAYTQRHAQQSGKTLCWFSPDEHNDLIRTHRANGGRVVFVRDGRFIYCAADQETDIAALSEAPMTFNGTARHNIENALGVIGLSMALELPLEAIRNGLRAFSSDPTDNPGRGNVYHCSGVTVVVDFAHNEHSMSAMVNMVRHMPARQRLVMFGHAGDRTDRDIHDLTRAVSKLEADMYIASELPNYLRGRELGDIPALIKESLIGEGVAADKFVVAAGPLEGAKLALSQAQDGDVLLLFVLDERQAIHEWLSAQVDA